MSGLISQDFEWSRFKRFALVSLVIASALIGLGILYRSIMVAMVAGAIIAYIFNPLVNRLCAHWAFRRQPLVGMLIFLAVTIVTIVGILIVPFIYEELASIISRTPEALSYVERLMIPLVTWLKKTHMFPDESIEAGFRQLNLLQNITPASRTVRDLFLQTPVLLEVAFNLLMVPLVTYLLLAEKDDLARQIKRWTPEDTHPLISIFIHRVDVVMRSVVKGQFLIAFILAFLYMAGFHLIGVPSGVAIGAIAGVCRLVPYLDVVVGLILCSIVVLTQGAGIPVFLAVLGVIAVVQSLDGMIITPRIIGDRAGLHPVVVIASVFAFGSWFGLLGVLLAVPTVAAVVVAGQTCLPFVKKSPFFLQGRAMSPLEAAPLSEQPPKQNSI